MYESEYAVLAHPVDYRAEVERYKVLLTEMRAERDEARACLKAFADALNGP